MEKLHRVLAFLEGKKTHIVGIAGAVNTYLIAASVITPELGALFATILVSLGSGAAYVTNQAYKNGALGVKK